VRQSLLCTMTLGLTVVGTGCATALNIQDASRCKPYGGVTMPLTEFFGGCESGEASEYSAFLFWPFWLFDKPFSLVGDTLALPYTLRAQRNTQSPPKNQSTQSPPSEP
jgi:uncharacterized protein YceK